MNEKDKRRLPGNPGFDRFAQADSRNPLPGQENVLGVGGDGVGIRVGLAQETPGAEPREDEKDRIRRWNEALEKYRKGKNFLDARIVAAEDYWKQRHWRQIRGERVEGEPEPTSAWLVNVILSKHSDAVDAYPEPNCLAREESDKQQAMQLSSILPVVLEQNDFAQVWSDVWWYKLKSGTGVYGVFWDPTKHNGLGDIAIEKVDILNLFWEPGVKNLQDSRYLFYSHLLNKEDLEDQYPQLAGALKGMSSQTAKKYHYSDAIDTQDKAQVVDVYYKRRGKLHFAKYTGENLLYCTEDDPNLREKGLYDHGLYPFVFDPLFPEEGYPGVGYGYVDLVKDPQRVIDILDNAFVQAAVANATPRWFIRADGGVNEQEYADMTKKFVHTTGRLGAESIMPIPSASLDGNTMTFKDSKIQEIKEVSGNRDVNNGGRVSGVTSGSAIAALQEAGNSLSRDMISSSYRAFRRMVELCIELIRQFYDLPRWFRIVGSRAQEEYIRFSNAGMVPVKMGIPGSQDPYYRLPVFDVKVAVAQESKYSKAAQNQLAEELYGLGAFNPQMAPQILPMLDMMDFKGREDLMETVRQNGDLFQQLQKVQAMLVEAMKNIDPAKAQVLAQTFGMEFTAAPAGAVQATGGGLGGDEKQEAWQVRQARENAEGGAIPQ